MQTLVTWKGKINGNGCRCDQNRQHKIGSYLVVPVITLVNRNICAFLKRISDQKFCVVWFPCSWMAVPLSAAKTNNYVKGQRSRWRGGPRLPAAARWRRSRSRDDLEVEGLLNVSSGNSFTTAMLAEHLNTRESSTRAPVNRASLVVEHWIQRPRSGGYSYSKPDLIQNPIPRVSPLPPLWLTLAGSSMDLDSPVETIQSVCQQLTVLLFPLWLSILQMYLNWKLQMTKFLGHIFLRRNLSKTMPTTMFHFVDWNS